MTKISVFIESKAGELLGEVISFKDRISIGSGDGCSICLKNCKFAEVECEVYLLNNECWLQVGKDGAPVSYVGKQHRSLKITQSSQFYTRDVVLKVILDSVQEFESEATKIVNETLLDTSERTRIVSSTATGHADVALDLSAMERTRVVSASELTKIVAASEETKGGEATEQTRIVTSISATNEPILENTLTSLDEITQASPQMNSKDDTRKYYIGVNEEDFLDKIQSFFARQNFAELLGGSARWYEPLHLKEKIFPIIGIVCIAVAIFIYASRGTKSSHPEMMVETKIPTKTLSVPAESTDVSRTENSTNASIQTKEGYLNEMSSLFD